MRRHEIGERLGVERTPSREELVEDEAERVDVAPDRHLASFELLGRHVGGRAGDALGHRTGRGEAEVHDADPAGAVEHDVRGLQIAMDHAALVGGREAGADLPRDLERLVLRQTADTPQQRRQILAVHVLHRQEEMSDASPMSYTRQTFGCDTCRAVRTSLWNCASRTGSWLSVSGRNFSATGWPSRRSSAR